MASDIRKLAGAIRSVIEATKTHISQCDNDEARRQGIENALLVSQELSQKTIKLRE